MKARNKQQILDSLSQNANAFKNLGVSRIGLFGSYVAGTQTEASDVDLLVEFEQGKKSFDNFMGTVNFTEELLGREVELVTPESLSPYIAPHILQTVEYVQTA
jgi:hypothetical protein